MNNFKVCKNCNGTGEEILFHFVQKCKICNGTGQIEIPQNQYAARYIGVSGEYEFLPESNKWNGKEVMMLSCGERSARLYSLGTGEYFHLNRKQYPKIDSWLTKEAVKLDDYIFLGGSGDKWEQNIIDGDPKVLTLPVVHTGDTCH